MDVPTRPPNILDVLDRLRADDPPLDELHPSQFDRTNAEFEGVLWNGRFTFVPSEALHDFERTQPSFMYRGQTQRYRPCLPSLLRGVDFNDKDQVRARLLLQRVRTAELELVLRAHPFTEVSNKHGFAVHFDGLAQHYGIPTAQLDLTSRVEVAAFFAVASFTAEGRWEPKGEGAGVLYRFDWTAFGPGYSKFFEPVGFGPGIRPTRQHAFTFTPHPGRDFEGIPHVEPIEFRHDKQASERVFELFEGGEYLYPPDCLASLVQKLRDLPFLTMHAIRHAAMQDGQAEEQIERAAESGAMYLNRILNIDIIDGYELAPEHEDLELARKQAPALDKQIAAIRKGFRLTRTRARAVGDAPALPDSAPPEGE